MPNFRCIEINFYFFSVPADEDEIELRQNRARTLSLATTKSPEKTPGLILGVQRIFSFRDKRHRARPAQLERQTTSFSLYKGLSPSLQSLAKEPKKGPSPDRSIMKSMKTSFSANDRPVFALESSPTRPSASVTIPDLQAERRRSSDLARIALAKHVASKKASSVVSPQYLEMQDQKSFSPGDPDEKVPADNGNGDAQPWRPAPPGRGVIMTGGSGTFTRGISNVFENVNGGRFFDTAGKEQIYPDGDIRVPRNATKAQVNKPPYLSAGRLDGDVGRQPLHGILVSPFTFFDYI